MPLYSQSTKWKEKYLRQLKPYKLISEEQVARMLGCPIALLVEARYTNAAPTSHEKKGKIYYHRKTIFKWIYDLCAQHPEDLEIFELYETNYIQNND